MAKKQRALSIAGLSARVLGSPFGICKQETRPQDPLPGKRVETVAMCERAGSVLERILDRFLKNSTDGKEGKFQMATRTQIDLWVHRGACQNCFGSFQMT